MHLATLPYLIGGISCGCKCNESGFTYIPLGRGGVFDLSQYIGEIEGPYSWSLYWYYDSGSAPCSGTNYLYGTWGLDANGVTKTRKCINAKQEPWWIVKGGYFKIVRADDGTGGNPPINVPGRYWYAENHDDSYPVGDYGTNFKLCITCLKGQSTNINGIDVLGSTNCSAASTVTPPDKGSPPTDIILDNLTIKEYEPAGTLVGKLTGVDPDNDIDGFFMFGLFTVPYGSNTKFAINTVSSEFHLVTDPLETVPANTGLPVAPLVTPFFHYDTEQSYDIKIRAIDSFGQAFDKIFTITVIEQDGIEADSNYPLESDDGTLLFHD